MRTERPEERRHGYLTGPVVIEDKSGKHDLRGRTWIGPTAESGDRLAIIECHAKFVILVEKRGVFERLVQDQFHLTNQCVLATGNGYPGRRYWALLHHVHDQLNLPFYVLADNDPPGYQLFFLIARGTARRKSRVQNAIAIPEARYLGLQSDDYQRLGMSESSQIHLRDTDLEQLSQFKLYPWLKSNSIWQRQFDEMLRNGFKIEMEALIGLGVSYLAETYLPERLAAGEYLRL